MGDGKVKVMFALTSIKGVGRRFSNVCCKKAEVDLNKRAGELTAEEVERLVTIVQNPRQFKMPDWILNRKKDVKDGKFSQVVSNTLDMKLREDLERMKKIRAHRGLRHYWGLRVRGQRTKTKTHRRRLEEKGLDVLSRSLLMAWRLLCSRLARQILRIRWRVPSLQNSCRWSTFIKLLAVFLPHARLPHTVQWGAMFRLRCL